MTDTTEGERIIEDIAEIAEKVDEIQEALDPSPALLTRTFDAEFVEGDGRTLEARIVPYGVSAIVADPPDWEPYEEMFMQGSLRGATKAPHRVLLDFEHQLSMSGVLGHAVEIFEREDGGYGRFRVTEHADGDKALALVRSKVLTAMSASFRPLGKSPKINGIVQRLKVHLDRVALCRTGAYEQATVIAVRTKPIEPEQKPLAFDPELAERMERLGLTVPEGLRGTA
jgi:HK97 family phage prohead protease